tara:strand:- start:230 stop:706 length:477 start_codon:yes stop_codon:yes gene_type:complete
MRNRLSYRLPHLTEYIRQQLLDRENISNHLGSDISKYFFNVFSDDTILQIIGTMDLDYFELLSYVNYLNQYSNPTVIDILEARDRFTTLKLALQLYHKDEIYAWNFDIPKREFLYQKEIDEYNIDLVARKIAINKLKRNKIVNLGVLLNLSMKNSGIF